MTPLATVLYEDSMLPGPGGEYPLHDLLMRIVEDEINGQTYRLRALVAKNPRRGIDNLLKDLPRTGLLAGEGLLFLLIDRDRISRHLQLAANATDEAVMTALMDRSDAPDKLRPFFLQPNVEGLLRSIRGCDPTLLPANLAAALQKKLNDRDIVFNEAKKAERRTVRDCVRRAQPGLDAMVRAIVAIIPAEAVA